MTLLVSGYSLWWRDVVRFARQRSRVIGALGTPLVFWVLLGSGLGSSFRPAIADNGSDGYLAFFYSGTLALILLFTAIFSTISVIEDRHEGFLQGVLVSPAPRTAIVLGKVLSGATLALLQAGLFLFLAPVAGIELTWGALPLLGVVLATLAVALTGLGFTLAWLIDSTQGFHAIMNLLLFPMWLLSGAVFPASGAAGWIQRVMAVNPMTYGVSAIRDALEGDVAAAGPPLTVVAVFGLATIALGAWTVHRTKA